MTDNQTYSVKEICDQINHVSRKVDEHRDAVYQSLYDLRKMVQSLCSHPTTHVESGNGGTWYFDVCDVCGRAKSKTDEENQALYREAVGALRSGGMYMFHGGEVR